MYTHTYISVIKDWKGKYGSINIKLFRAVLLKTHLLGQGSPDRKPGLSTI